jgi:hypothetical protein
MISFEKILDKISQVYIKHNQYLKKKKVKSLRDPIYLKILCKNMSMYQHKENYLLSKN